MRNFTILQKRVMFSMLSFVLCITGVFIFQGQDIPDENDPYIDRPTREFYTHFVPPSPHPLVLTDAQGFDNYDIGFNNAEQSMMMNTRNPLQIFFGVNSAAGNTASNRTTNGGLSWFSYSSFGTNNGDPWVAVDSLGNLYLQVLTVTAQTNPVFKSTDWGSSWGAGIPSATGSDRNTLAADQTAGPYSNYLYAAVTPGNFVRSTNLGANFNQTYNATNTVPGVMIAVGPNGSTQGGCVIYVSNTGSTASVTYTFNRSLDGGATFTTMSNLNVAGYVGTLNTAGRLVINNARTRPYPMIAMDNSYGPYRGRLYLVYASNEPAGNGNKPDVKLQYSTNQGATWSAWVRVNDNVNPEQSDQWFPAIWCDKETGKLYIKWYDDREDPANYLTSVYATYSADGGQTFAANQKISVSSFTYPTPACPPEQNCYRGDYDAITSNRYTSFAVWSAASYTNVGSYFPDFAMKRSPDTLTVTNFSDSAFGYVSVPAVKLYTSSARFTASLDSPPVTGTVTLTFLNRSTNQPRDSLTSYPDSLKLRVVASGLVTLGNYTISVLGQGINGTPVHKRTFVLKVIPPIGIKGISTEIPKQFYLYQNYPNPFNPNTQIRFDMAKAGNASITVFDISGKAISVVANRYFSTGSYILDFNADELASGVYFYKLEAGDFTSIRKMIVLK